ncbi:MAG TPA: hypothetical protein VFA85_13380 [Terriglobales bacterium]|nr:hypothetical protein [Terriglobales bacterium]
MARNHQGPLWNQDLVLAIGLAIAGIAILQSKLFPASARIDLPFLNQLLAWKVFEWWPVLLIGGGVVLWARQILSNRSKRHAKSVAQVGGSR